MGWRDRLRERAGLVTQAQAEERAHEAYATGYQDGNDEPPSGTTASYGYRRQTTSGLRDFTLLDVDQVREIVWTLFQSNPIIKRANQIKRDYILDRGVSPKTEDQGLQEILDNFWQINDLEQRQKEFTTQLFLFGEQCFPAFVRKTDGRVKLGYLDPADIQLVVTHPDNALERWAVVTKPTNPVNSWETAKPSRVFRIIREEEKESGGSLDNIGEAVQEIGNLWDPERSNQMAPPDPNKIGGNGTGLNQDTMDRFRNRLFKLADRVRPSKMGKLVTHDQAILEDWERAMLKDLGREKYDGSCFFFRVNSISNNPRGVPDYVQVADWTDQHDATLFNLADREQLASYFSWMVSIEGGPRDVKQRSKELAAKPPRRGSVNVHNNQETWEMVHPDIQATNSIETANALLIQVLGGLGLPKHWYGSGDETNRATAQAQGDPTWKTLSHDQGIVRIMLKRFLIFVRDQAEIAGAWKPSTDPKTGKEVDYSIDVPMPEMTAKDSSMIATMLSTLASALVVAEEQGWQDRETSREIWANALVELGIELDVSEPLPPEPIEDDSEDMGPSVPGKEWGDQHGVFLPDYMKSEEWGLLSDETKEEIIFSALERLGIKGLPETLDLELVQRGE